MGMFDFVRDIGNYESRKVNRTYCKNRVGVSTAWSSDEGYETALLDKNGAHPVERYGCRGDAEKGHGRWVVFAKNGVGKEVAKLGGMSGLVEDESITIEV